MPNFSLDDAVFERAAEKYPTPFYLYDGGGIRRAARELYAAFAWNKGFRQYYAVKALPNPAILKLLMEEGCGLDCSSHTELLLARMAGARGEDIMFSANAMPLSELTQAREMGACINLDDASDADSLLALGPVPRCVSLRVNPGQLGAGHNGIMGGALDAKFGLLPGQLEPALLKLKAAGLARFGLHAMTVSNTLDSAYYPNNAALLFKLGLELEAKTGLRLDFVNLSGGLGIPYHEEEQPLDLAQTGEAVRLAYQQAFGAREDVRLFTELGRLITGPYGWLVARAIHKKSIWRDYVGLDASAANLMRPAMYGAWHHISVAGKRGAPHDHVYDITGPLCENNDKFAVKRALPEINVGDLVILHDAGAHGHAMGYQYNGRLRSAELLLQADGALRLIRRAETPEDYFATLVMEG
ncbi:MAG TPA: diaminopimelate decarboxylase [Clostridia bacterium]|nr:diaminopimelate decarboxylase [Clostridia bacterium]